MLIESPFLLFYSCLTGQRLMVLLKTGCWRSTDWQIVSQTNSKDCLYCLLGSWSNPFLICCSSSTFPTQVVCAYQYVCMKFWINLQWLTIKPYQHLLTWPDHAKKRFRVKVLDLMYIILQQLIIINLYLHYFKMM